jgi:hypothetical protein
MSKARSRRFFLPALVLPAILIAAPLGWSAFGSRGGDALASSASRCPAGFVINPKGAAAVEKGAPPCIVPGSSGPKGTEVTPETYADLSGGALQQFAKEAAPRNHLPRNVYIKAIRQRRRVLGQGQSPQNRHRWHAYGRGPLRSGDKPYVGVNGLGLRNVNGRITDFAYVPTTDKHYPGKLFASVAYGGVWESKNLGKSWFLISKRLPTQIVGSVGYTPYKGGTIVAITGDGSFGRYSREGAGAYYTRNGGKKWHRSKGVPSDAFGFNVATDPAHPKRVYVATGAGLFRSSNGGKSFKNVKLPTGRCKGKSNRVKKCLLANIVTDVVVQAPKGSTNVKGGKVLAAVGWRGGSRKNPNGWVQSPHNGLYLSKSGKPGSFKRLSPTGFAEQPRIGRTELGAAIGPDQDHNYVYAIVQDAVLLRGGTPGVDAPGGNPLPKNVPTVLNGIYASSDFGKTWTKMADASELQGPETGSALAGTAQALSNYGPGVQAWYNEWIQPDPTLQTGGVPTRLLFGLEEVWENEDITVPQTGHSKFRVIGRYFSGRTCLFLETGLPACPTQRGEPLDQTTTTHPDQHAAVIIPNPDPEQTGGARLVVGNDGGAFAQNAPSGDDFDNASWGKGSNAGFQTLLPYDAAQSQDGTVWIGLQDNGTGKIQDVKKKGKIIHHQRQMETLGGDGFFVGVDPLDSNLAYGEYTYGAMSATKDGGRTWSAMSPPGLSGTTAQFSNPFVVDPKDAQHVLTAGNQVDETGSGPGTGQEDWAVDYFLGTAQHPGDKSAQPSATDPVNQMSAIDMRGARAYVGFCGVCNVLDNAAPFKNGLATNVGGNKKPKRYTSHGWHIAKKKGLPNRYITSLAIAHKKPSSVYAALGGYNARWVPPGAYDKNKHIGRGHLFVSHDAGDHFKNISGNLPNTPVNWVTLRGKQLLVATDVGVYISKPHYSCAHPASKKCHRFQLLGRGLPTTQISTIEVAPCDKNLLTVATFGRGVWQYRFGPKGPPCKRPKVLPPPAFQGKKVAGPYTFETGNEGWTTKGSSGVDDWHTGPPGHASAQAMQVEAYQNAATYSLISPKNKLPARANVKVTWWDKLNTEPCCDFLSLEWSSDGYVWHSAGGKAGMNADYPNFSQESASFVAPKGDLYIRFRLTSDALVSSPPYEGAGVDDVVIEY